MAHQDTKKESSEATVRAFRAIMVLALGLLIGYFVYSTTLNTDTRYPFKLGLDLAGGSHLIYEADVSALNPAEVPDLMNVLRDVIERRINVFGVSEPIVQVEKSSFVSDVPKERLVVELPGVSDVEEAIKEIGKTPLLEFKLVDQTALAAQKKSEEKATLGADQSATSTEADTIDPYIVTGLSGRYLKRAELVFGQANQGGLANEPTVSIEFNEEGAALFEQITKDNVGEQLAIFLDGVVMSSPRINEGISGGKAIISGNFTPEEARDLVRNLNFGALPVPITLMSTQTIGASLGSDILDKGIRAGLIGLIIVALYMIIWYRLLGVVSVIALLFYTVSVLALFKLIPVTLTAAGLAGFILSVGMAVDANVLIFERIKEEYRNGKSSREATLIGFTRAWSAIRDSNVTSILSAIILFWFGTSVVKGFALVFGIGVIVSMLSAISITRTLLLTLPNVRKSDGSLLAKLYGTGFLK